jgi:hypothetical protein
LFILSSHSSPSHHQQTFSVASSGVAASTSTDTTTVIRTFCFTFDRSLLFFFFRTIGHGAAAVDARHKGSTAKDEDGDDTASHAGSFISFGERSPGPKGRPPGERERRFLSTGD